MKQQNTMESERLLYRPFEKSDAALIYTLLQEKEIFEGTMSIPYPYQKEDAQVWIDTHPQRLQKGEYQFAVVLKENKTLIGAIEMVVQPEFQHGFLGYWLGKPYWRKGYGSEAAKRIIEFGFEELRLHKVCGEHFAHNIASARVMEKNGMQQEGRLREHKIKWGEFVDIDVKGILKTEWQAHKRG